MAAEIYSQFTRHDERFDAIVIGSGIGGLSVASLLSKIGKQKVLVLERHYTVGGYTQTFQRLGYTWDAGLHYVGQVHIPGTTLNKAFRYISNDNLKWAPLDTAYDRIVFGDKHYNFTAGEKNLKAMLKENFPSAADTKAIDDYFALLHKVEKISIGYYAEKVIPPFLAKLFGTFLRRKVLRWSDQTTLDVLHTLTDNEKLISVLTAQYGDYGLLPSQSSFYMHALLANHYMDGAGYPVGGAGNIAATVTPVIEENGGAVLYRAEVKQIIVENNVAVGVEMLDGKRIYAQRIVSDAGIMNTFGSLLPPAVAEKHHLPELLKNLTPSAAHMGLYIGIEQSPEALKLPSCNYWVFPDEYNHEASRERYKNIDDEIPVAYISFPSAKDPAWSTKHPGKSTVEAIIIVPNEWFARWENTTWRRRGEEYEQMKKRVAEQILEIIYRVEPQLRGTVNYYDISTPLSTKKFTNHQHGEIYGVAHTPKRFRQRFLKPYTPVKNLFLTGQDVMIASIAGGLMGGVLCATAILKKNVLWKIIRSVK